MLSTHLLHVMCMLLTHAAACDCVCSPHDTCAVSLQHWTALVSCRSATTFANSIACTKLQHSRWSLWPPSPGHYCCCLTAVTLLHFCPASFPQVTPGSPAARAGLRPTSRNSAGDLILGDIIQGVDGNTVSSARDLLEQLDAKRVGDKVVVDVLRGGRQRLCFSLQLADRVLGSGTE
jgi:hypothetical protein